MGILRIIGFGLMAFAALKLLAVASVCATAAKLDSGWAAKQIGYTVAFVALGAFMALKRSE